MLSDLKFTVVDAPDWVQSHFTLATLVIPEDPTIKGIFAAEGVLVQFLAVTTTIDVDTGTLMIPKSQVAILAKKGYTLVDQNGNSYSMNDLILPGCTSFGSGITKPTVNGETNTPYLLHSSYFTSVSR